MRETRRLVILSLAIFALAVTFTALVSIFTSYRGYQFGHDLLFAASGVLAIGILIPAVEPRPDYTRNAYVSPGTHMKVYARQSTTPNPDGESLAWKKQAGLSQVVTVSLEMILSGLFMLAVSLLIG